MYARSTNIGNILNDFLSQLCFFTQFLLNFIQDNIDLNIKKKQQKKRMFNYIARLYNFIFTQVKINSLFHNVHNK